MRRTLLAAMLCAGIAGSAVSQNYPWNRVLELQDDVSAMAASGNYFWAVGRTSGEIWRSGNGTQWSRISALSFSTQEKALCLAHNALRGLLLAGTTYDIYRSDDNGASWFTAYSYHQAPVYAILANAGNGNMLYAATGDGIIWSSDGGWYWDLDGLQGRRVNDLAYLNGYFFAATDSGIFIRSTSQKWSAARLAYPNSGVAALAVGDSGRVYASLQTGVQNAIVFTRDYGVTWGTGMYLSSLPPVPDPMAVSPDGRLFAYGSNTLYSWRQPGFAREETRLKDAINPDDFFAGDLLIDPASGYAYICGWQQGSLTNAGRIYRSGASTRESPDRLGVLRSPQSVPSGWDLAPPPVVGILDSYGVLLGRSGLGVTVSLSGGTPGSQLSGISTRQTNSIGTAMFPGLTVDLAGLDYELVFQSSGLQPALSDVFDIVPGVPARMVFTAWPNSGVALETLSVFTAELQDSTGNPATNITADLLLTKTPAAGTLSGTLRVPLVGGKANWDDLSMDTSGTYIFATEYSSGISATTPSIPILPAPDAVALRFVQDIPTLRAGEVFQARVHFVDANGKRARKETRDVRLRVGNDPPPDTLRGVTTGAGQEGEAFFDQLMLRRAGAGYYLIAEADGLPPAMSNTFTVVADAPARLRITNVLTDVAVDEPFALELEVRDRYGNRNDDFSQTVALALQGPGPGQLRGTLQKLVRGGEVFSGLSVDAEGDDYRIAASSTGLTPDTSNAFSVRTATAHRLRFTVQPSGGSADDPLTAQPRIAVQDADGRLVTVDGLDVTLSVLDHPGVTLEGGPNPIATVAGVAAFSGLLIRDAGTGYRLVARAAGMTSDTSDAFSIRHGAAANMVYRSQPGNAVVNAVIPPVVVAVEDRWRNTVTDTPVQVSLSLENDAGGGAILSGRSPRNTVSGEALFDALRLDKPGTGYTLRAMSPGLPNVVSQPFDILEAGAAFRLSFDVQPGDGSADRDLAPQPVVAVLDADGGRVDNSTALVELTVLENRASLRGQSVLQAAQGRASFSGLRIAQPGSGYALVATSAGLVPDTSALFDIVPGAPVQLGFLQQPTDAGVNELLTPDIIVAVLDSEGNIVDTSSAWIALEFERNPGQANLGGSTLVQVSGGVARFDDLSLDATGVDYRLRARSAGLQSAVSDAFSITSGIPAQLVFLQQPGDVAVNQRIAPGVIVAVMDSDMNIVDTSTAWIRMEFAQNPGQGNLNGTTAMQVTAGVAVFDDLAVDEPGAGYRLRALSAGLPSAVSDAFSVTSGTPAKLVFLQQPADAGEGVPIDPEIIVAVADSDDNIVDTSSAWITLEIGSNPGAATMSGTAARRASGGVARFDDIALDAAGTGYTLRALSAGLASAVSVEFTVVGTTERFMTITGGNDQRGATGSVLPQNLEVTVRYGSGQPAEGVPVAFQLEQPPGATGGRLDPAQMNTGPDGRARTQLTLGNRLGVYRVRATSAGIAGSPLLFTATAEPPPYPATVDLDHDWRFVYHEDRGAYSPRDYRIISLPGEAGIDVSTLLTGRQNENWKLFTDDGSEGEPSAYLRPYDGSPLFQARPGRAFWLLHRGDVALARTVPSAPVDAGRNAAIALHEGWNLIGNPFARPMPWSVVQQVNGVIDPLYRFDETRGTHPSFDPYVGYYYFNRDGLPALLIPWDSLFTTTRFAADERGWTVGISLAYGTVTDRTLAFGVHPEAENAFDRRDYPAPRVFGGVFASFAHPEWQGAQRYCGRDTRSADQDEHQWTLSIETERREVVTLLFEGLDAVPDAVDLLLEDPLTGERMSLRRQRRYTVFTDGDVRRLRIHARPADHRSTAAAAGEPALRVGAPYPNPTSRGAAVSLRVARDAVVEIAVRDVLGRLCRILHAGLQQRGMYQYYWDGRDDAGAPLPAGLYFIHVRGASSRVTSAPLILLAR